MSDNHETPQEPTVTPRPRIFRPAEKETAPQVPASSAESAEQAEPRPRPAIARILDESTQRFGAGTTYSGTGTGRPTAPRDINVTPKAPTVQRMSPSQEPSPPPRRPTLQPAVGPVSTASAAVPAGSAVSVSSFFDLNFYAVLTMVLAIVFPPLAIPVAHMTRAHVQASGSQGDSVMRAGIVLAYVSLAVFTCALFFSVVAEVV